MKPSGIGIFAPGTNMAVHRGDQRGGQGETGRDLSGLGTSPQRARLPSSHTPAHRVRDNGTAAKLAAGVGFRATSSRNGGRPHPRMVGESTKTEPRLLR